MRSLLHLCLLAWLCRCQYREATQDVCRPQRTSVACNAASFFRSSDPRFVMARVVSVRSWLAGAIRTLPYCLVSEKKKTHRLFRNVDESRGVPSWSTSLKIPCTFAFILKTRSAREDCKLRNAASSRDCGIWDGGERGCPWPDSMS